MKYVGQQFETVENTPDGREEIIRLLAKQNGWKVTCRGRGNRVKTAEEHARLKGQHPQNFISTFRQSLPLCYAERIAVYIQNKGNYMTASDVKNIRRFRSQKEPRRMK